MIRPRLILFFALILNSYIILGQSHAAPTPALVTSGSLVRLEGLVPAHSKWICFETTYLPTPQPPGNPPESKSTDTFTRPDSQGNYTANVYLNEGPGLYKISIYYKFDDAKFGTYIELENVIVENTDPRDLRFLLPSDQIQSDAKPIQELAAEIGTNLNTDFEKAKAIHDWVATHIEYDYTAALPENLQSGNHSPTALDTLEKRKGVCEGYAALVSALARAMGMRSRVVDGITIQPTEGETWADIQSPQTPTHSWNEIWVNDKWLVLDSTWDTGGKILNGNWVSNLQQTYFDPTAIDFALDHKKIANSRQ